MNPAILRARELTLRYGNRTILNQVDLSLPQHSVIGLVGINGSGKSSLLKILASLIEYDEGEITIAKKTTIQYVPQEFEPDPKKPDLTCEQFLLTPDFRDDSEDVDGSDRLYHERLEEIKVYFGRLDPTAKLTSLSGGQKRQLTLLKALAQRPDILLLDEPTNHLDLTTMIAIQSLFKNYTGTILMISHDRYFLDNTVDTIWELDDGNLFTHTGTYTDFLYRKQQRRQIQTQTYLKLKQELKREYEWFVSGVKARGTKDSGRMTRYLQLKADVKALKPRWKELKLPLPQPQPLGKKILNLQEVAIAYPGAVAKTDLIVRELNFQFQEGMRVGLLGPNGSGKTTLIRALLGIYKKQAGKISVGQNTIFNYHDQNRQELDLDSTLHYTISEDNLELKFGERKMNIFAYMKKFLFDSDDLKKEVRSLSGGERARLLLAKILKEGGNFLILDEPTNDLDLDTIQALENTLLAFNGCALLVSHDRFFLDRVCTHIIALEGNGNFTISSGGYSRYINHYKREADFWQGRSRASKLPETPIADVRAEDTESANLNLIAQQMLGDTSTIEQKKKPSLKTKEIRQIKAQIRIVETNMKDLEDRISALAKRFNEPEFYTQPQDKIIIASKNLGYLREELDKYESRWLELKEQIS
jgi:ATP-binding cassette subfamily F protein uup